MGQIVRNLAAIGAITVAIVAVVVIGLPFISGVISLAAIILFGGAVWMTLSVISGLLDIRQLKSSLL